MPYVVTATGIGKGGKTVDEPGEGVELVEFYHPEWDHYFLTANSDEIAKLDSGACAGWMRSGLSFFAYEAGKSDGTPVCRFFSTAFGERSSHFYTPSATECAAVSALADWSFEGSVFAMTRGGRAAWPSRSSSR